MKGGRDFLRTFLLAFFVSPLIVGVGAFFGVISAPAFALIPALIVLIWALYAWKARLPDAPFKRYLPVLCAFGHYMLLWIGCHFASGLDPLSERFPAALFTLLAFPYFPLLFLLSFGGSLFLFPFVQMILYGVIALTMLLTDLARRRPLNPKKGLAVLAAAFVALSAAASLQYAYRDSSVLPQDYDVARVEDEVDLYRYRPFAEDSLLKIPDEAPELTFESNHPRLDGATAAYPVYAAMAQWLYQGLDEESAEETVRCSKTAGGYEALVRGDADVFFGAQPSEAQQKMAEEAGVRLKLTPIGREAFVFFVNAENPVRGLTVEQIRNIYLKNIVNWKDVGGQDERIMPFQRPENSGSQTIMLAKVMEGRALPPPLKEEYAEGMGGIIRDVADYRNYSSAIGYSFRFFATGMALSDGIRLLAIDGIEPTAGNIRSGAYPFTVDVYAVTAGNESENTQKLIEWCLGDQGQRLIEACGYVGL